MTYSTAGTYGARPAEISLAGLARGLLRRRRLVIGLALVSAFITGALGLVRKRTWTSAATFMPQSRRTPTAGLSGIAAQLGISFPTVDAGQGPAFYSDLLTSRAMLGALADTTFEYQAAEGPVRVTLADIFRVKARTPALRREAVIRKLGKRITAVAVLKTGVVRVRVTTLAPDLARSILEFVLDRLNLFNLETRQSQARAERRFMEARLDEARGELRAAEDRLQNFLQRNRDYRNSPELSFEQDRLSREVQMRQQVYTTLAQGYEQAKLEEVRDTPVITVVEPPETPVRPDPRGIVASTLVALIAGGLMGALLAFMLAALERERAVNAEEVLGVEAELRAAVTDLRHPWRLLLPSRRER
jgi:uncharacterized protein involved in exopolysaccharide biosynthesis